MRVLKGIAEVPILVVLCFILGTSPGSRARQRRSDHRSCERPERGRYRGRHGTLVNPATNEKRTADTNDSGDYVFNAVDQLPIPCRSKLGGFKGAVREGVILHVAEKVSVNFILVPGDMTQTIEVPGELPYSSQLLPRWVL